jgi:hypothetical protein
MAVRFRIRTSQGQEVSFASHQGFEEFVRSGDLAPDDLVYDAETGEWAPARTHPLVLEIEYEHKEPDLPTEGGQPASDGSEQAEDRTTETPHEATEGPSDFGLSLTDPDQAATDPDQAATDPGQAATDPGQAATDPSQASADPGQASADPDPASASEEGSVEDQEWPAVGADLGLDLAPSLGSLSPKEASKQFVERMESERARDRELGGGTPAEGIRMEGSTSLADMVRSHGELAPEPSPARRRAGAPVRTTREEDQRSGVGRRVVLAVLAAGALGAAGYLGVSYVTETGLFPVASRSSEPDPVDPDPQPPPPPPVIAPTMGAVRERATERFLTATQSALTGLEPIPDAWATGGYLSLPSDHPRVRSVWEGYRATARRLRAQSQARYRIAYGRALADAGVREDPDRVTRLEAGVEAFRPRVADVEAHWGRVEALAVAAIQSHDALVEAEGVILYDPSGSTGRAGGIGAGTSGRDSDAQLLLDQVIDLLETALVADGMGPREGSDVREWVWGGFLAAVSR